MADFVFLTDLEELPRSYSLSIMLESSALWAGFVLIAPLIVFICCAMCFNAVFFTLSEFHETSDSLFRVPGTLSCIAIDWETLILPLSLFQSFFSPLYHSICLSVPIDWLP